MRDLLGHSSVKTTESFYIGAYKKAKEANAVAESLSKILEDENINLEYYVNENTLKFLNNLTGRRKD